jgi:hippurate hydrolase
MTEPLMGSEDFSLVLEEVPGAFMFLGARPGPMTGDVVTNHSARAAFDDGVLADQAAALAQLAFHKIITLAAS